MRWYASYMSASGVAREWIEALPAGTWFRSTAVPGERHIVRNVLHRMMAASRPIIGRASPGVYWRQPPPAADAYGTAPLMTPALEAAMSPPGSGYADRCALWRVGWSGQATCRTVVAVPYRNLKPPQVENFAPLRFIERSNVRRRALNWNEATLLEAARSWGWARSCDWDRALWCLLEADRWMKPGDHIHKERLMWVAAAEPAIGGPLAAADNQAFGAVLDRIEADLPDVLQAP